jgi:restriction endonuclease Mrr
MLLAAVGAVPRLRLAAIGAAEGGRDHSRADAGDELLQQAAEREAAADAGRLERGAREQRAREQIADAERDADRRQRLGVDEVRDRLANLLDAVAELFASFVEVFADALLDVVHRLFHRRAPG